MEQPAPDRVRLAELVASLSLATDLGLGQPQEHVLRQSVIARRLAAAAGLGDEHEAAVYYVSLLTWVGCIADSHELATWFGNDLRVRADSYHVDKAGLPMARFLLGQLAAAGGPPLRRIALAGGFLTGGFRDVMSTFVSHCETTGDIADRLGLDAGIRRALPQAFERWDGKGSPDGLRGDRIEPVMRIVQIADDVEVAHRVGGVPGALTMLRARRGSEFDPELVDLLEGHATEILGDLDAIDPWSVVIEGCAALDRRLDDGDLTAALEVFADYADLKSPWWLGHSQGVATLAADAADRYGLPGADVTMVRRAALVHRLGAIGVSAGIWDKATRLSGAEWERVRAVPYLTERVLSRQPALAAIGSLAGMSHERMDGSGYPRGLAGAAIPVTARLLAAADLYRTLSEDRPHRAALTPAECAAALGDQVAAGLLDADAVRAVLAAAGHRVGRRRRLVAGLTPREAEVLVLLARGAPQQQIARRLSIAPRTVGSHVEHIYSKIGVTTRGAAAMFAMRHGLVDASEDDGEVPAKIG